MKIVYKVLEDGFEQCVVEDDFVVTKPYTEIEPPQPNWRPTFNFRTQKWSEAATDEEMEPAEIRLTENEKTMQVITDLEIENMELRALFEQVWQTVTELEIQLLESGSE